MDSVERQMEQLGQQLFRVGLQVATAYSQAQAELETDKVLSSERLASAAGTQASRKAIVALQELTVKHKAVYSQIMLQTSESFLKVIAGFPEGRREAEIAELQATVQKNLSEQGAFYIGRETWCRTALEMCQLMDDHRDEIGISGRTLMIESDEVLDEFIRLKGIFEDIHYREVARFQELQARILGGAGA